MSGRMRSPSYPSTSLDQAIEIVGKLHKAVRTNPVDREVAAKELGYTGISGRSATVLANLAQYGLLEKAGKNEVRVTSRAVEILHPDSQASKLAAIREAAREPELFQRVLERFTDGLPSANALHSFFVKEGFTDTAIPSAIRAFQETFASVENANESESYFHAPRGVEESQPNPKVEEHEAMSAAMHSDARAGSPNAASGRPNAMPISAPEGPQFQWVQKRIWLGGVISDQAEAEELIAFINAVKPMLKQDDEDQTEAPAREADEL